MGLNPCFNGRYSLSFIDHSNAPMLLGLNPCFNGRYSLRYQNLSMIFYQMVLILVLMEDTH